jgi:hypothetical protein
MTAWVRGSKLDAGSFASHFFGRAADDPVVATLRAAVSEASFATTQAQLAKASGDLAEAMKAVGLDSWPRFVVDAQARARDPATVAATLKSLQPPDLKRDAITPVYPVEKALAVAAAGVTGGASGLVGAAARAVGGAVASKILGDNPAPPQGGQDTPQTAGKESEPKNPAAANKPGPLASEPASPSAAKTAGPLAGAAFAQMTFSQAFSAAGAFAGRTVSEVAALLRSGKLSPADVPVQFIIRDGRTLILNTRSAQALEQAGIPRSQWKAIDVTGNAGAEARLTGQLKRNGLTSEGTTTVHPSEATKK